MNLAFGRRAPALLDPAGPVHSILGAAVFPFETMMTFIQTVRPKPLLAASTARGYAFLSVVKRHFLGDPENRPHPFQENDNCN